MIDMKVRWSSTYLMLDRAERKKECIDNFVDELRYEETNSRKRDKIRDLKLDSEEWGRVHLFLGLLGICLSSFGLLLFLPLTLS